MTDREEALRAMCEALKPCPFCGCDTPSLGEGKDGPFVNCPDCLASTNVLIPLEQTKAEAAEEWNRRAPYGEIEARDETIRLLERQLHAAEADAARLAEALEAVAWFADEQWPVEAQEARDALTAHAARLIG